MIGIDGIQHVKINCYMVDRETRERSDLHCDDFVMHESEEEPQHDFSGEPGISPEQWRSDVAGL